VTALCLGCRFVDAHRIITHAWSSCLSEIESYCNAKLDAEIHSSLPYHKDAITRGNLVTADVYSEWLRRQGGHVIRTASSYWHSNGLRVYQAFPYHWLIHPPQEEISELFFRDHVVAVRYSTSPDALVGYPSYHLVYERPTYDFEDLGQWARKNVRRGLRNCVVEPISFERLVEDGWALRLDTLDRQGRRLKISFNAWKKRCLAGAGLPGFEAWGALVRGQLAAFLLSGRMEDCCYLLYQQCHRNYLREHVNNALGFAVTKALIGRQGVRSVFYGLQSLDAPSSVDEFKLRMGYAAKPVLQRVVFHPFFSPFVNRLSYVVLRYLAKLQPRSAIFSKAEGLTRFYLMRNDPRKKQQVPGE
jgi:hypothetical protein